MAIPDLQQALDLIEDGRAEEALPPLTAWAQQMPAHAAVHVVLAQAYEAMEQRDDARAAWQRAHFLMPNSPAVIEGLERIRAAVAERAPAGEDHLIMDLDLQAELEATLETLFDPLTPSQQSEAALEEESMPEEAAALEKVEAALAAAQVDAAEEEAPEAEIPEEIEAAAALASPEAETPEEIETAAALASPETETPEEIEAAAALASAETEAPPEETEPAETATEDAFAHDVESIYDEIDQLIEEKKTLKQATAETHEKDRPIAPVAEQEQAEQHDLEDVMGEEQEAIEALEARGEQAADEEALGLADWGKFKAEPEEVPPSRDATIDDLDRLIGELEAARIVPQPDLENIPPVELEDEIDDVVTETLARIYASQKKYDEAARIYEQLAHQQPQEAAKFLQLAAEMHGLAGGSDDQESPEDQG